MCAHRTLSVLRSVYGEKFNCFGGEAPRLNKLKGLKRFVCWIHLDLTSAAQGRRSVITEVSARSGEDKLLVLARSLSLSLSRLINQERYTREKKKKRGGTITEPDKIVHATCWR